MLTHAYQNATKYSKSNSLQYAFAQSLLSKIKITDDSRVLDIGCGDGKITNQIAQQTKECVIGTDLSKIMTDHASEVYKSQQNLKFVQMDASHNIFRNQFDLITSFNCLHWVKDQQAALRGISNAAAPNARVALLFSHRKSLYHEVLGDITSSPKWALFFEGYTSPRSFFKVDEYKKILADTDLQVEDIIEEEMSYLFDSKMEIAQFFHAAGSQINQVPKDHQESFLEDFSNEFVSRSQLTEDGKVPMAFWCLQVLAFKPALNPRLQRAEENDDTVTINFFN